MNIRKEISQFARSEDKPILNWLLDRYFHASRWQFVAKCTKQAYGTQSYQVNRVWEPTKEGRAIYHYFTQEVNSNERITIDEE